MRYEPGAAHILSCQLKNRSGEPIIDGTISLYLLCIEASTPVFENVWYKSDDSYNSPEEAYATAALATGSTQGVWAVEVRAEAFVAGRKYRAYWVDSAGRGEPYTEEIEVETGGTAIKTETATLAAVKPDYKPTVDSSGYTAVQADVDVDEAAIATAVVAEINESGVVVAAASTVGAFPAAALAAAPTGPAYTVQRTSVGNAPQVDITLYQKCAIPSTTITASTSQTAKEHQLIVVTSQRNATVAWYLNNTHFTVDGVNVTFADTDAYTQTAGTWWYYLKNTTDDVVICEGALTIQPTPETQT